MRAAPRNDGRPHGKSGSCTVILSPVRKLFISCWLVALGGCSASASQTGSDAGDSANLTDAWHSSESDSHDDNGSNGTSGDDDGDDVGPTIRFDVKGGIVGEPGISPCYDASSSLFDAPPVTFVVADRAAQTPGSQGFDWSETYGAIRDAAGSLRGQLAGRTFPGVNDGERCVPPLSADWTGAKSLPALASEVNAGSPALRPALEVARDTLTASAAGRRQLYLITRHTDADPCGSDPDEVESLIESMHLQDGIDVFVFAVGELDSSTADAWAHAGGSAGAMSALTPYDLEVQILAAHVEGMDCTIPSPSGLPQIVDEYEPWLIASVGPLETPRYEDAGSCVDGWYFESDRSEVTLCGAACDALLRYKEFYVHTQVACE